MRDADRAEFAALLAGVYEFYGKACSPFALAVWWQGMQQHDLAAVREALGRHCLNPDNGQFCPKPADVVRMMHGSTLDAAQLAWTKAIDAVHHVGTYETVCFDDPIINAVVSEMGGWIPFGLVTEKELPFKQREFEQRYRAYRGRGGVRSHPRTLPGRFDLENLHRGFEARKPVLVGDAMRAQAVLAGGSETRQLQFSPAEALPSQVSA